MREPGLIWLALTEQSRKGRSPSRPWWEPTARVGEQHDKVMAAHNTSQKEDSDSYDDALAKPVQGFSTVFRLEPTLTKPKRHPDFTAFPDTDSEISGHSSAPSTRPTVQLTDASRKQPTQTMTVTKTLGVHAARLGRHAEATRGRAPCRRRRSGRAASSRSGT